MSQPAVAFDAAAFLQALKFTAAELSAARTAARESREARAVLEQATETAGEGQAALRRATAFYVLGRVREAAIAARTAGESPQAKLVRGRAALEDGDPKGAADAFATIAGTAVAGGDLDVELATARGLTGDAPGTKAAAGKISGPARKADALFAEGLAAEADGDHAQAYKKWEAALESDPKHPRALFHLAHAYDLAGEDEKAIELYRRCTALEPTYVNALLNLGLLLEDHDRFTEAEALYRRVLASDPLHERARLYLKDVLSAQTMYFDEDSERKEDRRNQILRTPISEFELSVRSRNCLQKMEIVTLGDLVRKTEAELLAYKNFGETSLQEIKDILAQKSLRLGMGIEDGIGPAATREQAEAELDSLFGGDDDDDDLDEGKDPRTLPISALNLSVRAQKCIETFELETVGDLADRTAAELMVNKNFGPTMLLEVSKKLAGFGLALRGESAGAATGSDEGSDDDGDDDVDEDDGD